MIWQKFLEVVEKHANSPAVISDNEELTYVEFVDRVRQEALKLPMESKDKMPARVLILPTDPLEVLVRVFACWSVGLVPIILRDGQSCDSIGLISDIANPVAVLSDQTTSSASRERKEPLRFDPRSEALVMSTSGSTGTPKLVALAAEGILVTAQTIARDLEFCEGDVLAVCTPLSYMYGLMGGAVSGLLAGAAVRLFVPGKPLTEVQSAIRRESITVLQGPPSLMSVFFAYWSGNPFASVRLVTVGGECVDARLLAKIKEAFPQSDFRLVYGMTEAGPRVSHTKDVEHIGAGLLIGRPFDHIEWRIEAEHEAELPEGVGRLSLRGPNICLGYIEPENRYTGVGADGFFTSSDLVCATPDSQLCFLGRYDRLFKTRGKLINPAEIEEFLMRHPHVTGVACRPQKHNLIGLVPLVEVVLEKGSNTTSRDLLKYCSALAPHEIPHQIDIRPNLEIAASGKRVFREV